MIIQILLHRQHILSVLALIDELVHIGAHQMDAQSADPHLCGDKCCIHHLLSRRIEGLAFISELEGERIGIGHHFQEDRGALALREGVVHHIDHRLLHSQVHTGRGERDCPDT